jgi:hypothetical protein
MAGSRIFAGTRVAIAFIKLGIEDDKPSVDRERLRHTSTTFLTSAELQKFGIDERSASKIAYTSSSAPVGLNEVASTLEKQMTLACRAYVENRNALCDDLTEIWYDARSQFSPDTQLSIKKSRSR